MREDPVDERRVDRPGQDVRANDRRSRTTGLSARQRQRGSARWQFRSRQHRRERVENVMLRFLDDIGGQRAILGAAAMYH